MSAVADAIAADPAAAGLLLDFDGTLAPIVADPSTSAAAEGVREVLAALAGRVGALAVISGRPAAFLGERAAVPGVRCFGLYGLEEWCDGAARPRPEATAWAPAVRDAVTALAAAVGALPGVAVEDKGLAVGVHWRRAPDRAAAQAAVEAAVADVADRTGLAREPGKLVEELRPPVDWDKGATVRALVAETGVVLPVYAGDDRGDLAAFSAVRALGGRVVAVDHGAETPAEVRAAADEVLDGVEGMVSWLSALARRLG